VVKNLILNEIEPQHELMSVILTLQVWFCRVKLGQLNSKMREITLVEKVKIDQDISEKTHKLNIYEILAHHKHMSCTIL
jgi:hypothetical protein